MPPSSRPKTDALSLPARLSLFHTTVLIGILISAALLRFYRISQPSLWKDEIWSIEMSMGRGLAHDDLQPNLIRTDHPDLTSLSTAAPWWQICTHVNGVTHPPLYFVILRWWIDLFGAGALSIRSLSAIASLAAIPILFDICRILHGPKVALLATAITALSLGQIDFAQDARGYTLLLFFALACIDLLLRIELDPARSIRGTPLALCAAAALLIHYLAAGPMIALVVFAALRLRGPARVRSLSALAAAALIVVSIWIPLLHSQTHTLPSLTPTFLQEAHPEKHAKLTLYRVIGLPAEYLLGESRGEALARRTPNVVLAFFLLTSILPFLRLRRRPDLLIWTLWLAGAIGFVAAVDLLHGTTLAGYPRYTFLATPAIFAIIAAFQWPRLGPLRDLLPIACIAALVIGATDFLTSTAEPLEDWRQFAVDLNAAAGPNDLLIYRSPDPWVTPGLYYMCLNYYSPDSHRPWLILDDPADPKILNQISHYPGVWIIGNHPETDAPSLLPGWRPQSLITTSAGHACKMIPP